MAEDPKNIPMDWLDEMGVSGGVLLVLLIITIRNIIRRDTSVYAIAIGASWLSVIVAGQFDTVFGSAYRGYANSLIGALLGTTLLLPSSKDQSPAGTVSPLDTGLCYSRVNKADLI
jgi:hypothetical protein